jgi:hypothetical protein
MIDSQASELGELERIAAEGQSRIESRTLCHVACAGQELPVQAFFLGNPDPGRARHRHLRRRPWPGAHRRRGRHRLSAKHRAAACAGTPPCMRQLESVCAWSSSRWSIPAACGGARAPIRNGVDLMRNAPLEARREAALPDRRASLGSAPALVSRSRRNSRWRRKAAPCAIWIAANCSATASAWPSIAIPVSA